MLSFFKKVFWLKITGIINLHERILNVNINIFVKNVFEPLSNILIMLLIRE